MQKYTQWYENISKKDVGIVGGKGANLGELLSAGAPVPYGFVVTAEAFFYFIKSSGLEQKIKKIEGGIDTNDGKSLSKGAATIRQLIMDAKMPKDLADVISSEYGQIRPRSEKIYAKLKIKNRVVSGEATKGMNAEGSMNELPLVAVRSSATAEDLPTASFAGQQETYLNIHGVDAVLKAVQECWASLYTDRAIYYRMQQGFADHKVGLAAVVQLMAQSEKSGVAFSIDPVSNDSSKITIEAILGLGEYIVQGLVNPDHYEVDKKTLKIVSKQVNDQDKAFVKKSLTGENSAKNGATSEKKDLSDNPNEEVMLSKEARTSQKISDKEIQGVAALVKDIEEHYGVPQDIEWAIEGGSIYIVQSRPITTAHSFTNPADELVGDPKLLLLKCDPASPGIASGTPRVLSSPKENDLVKDGDILIATYTSPDYVPAMKRASAIITEMGGRTSHAAIVSRELGIPAIVGASGATTMLVNEKLITVNGSRGEVFRGDPYTKAQHESLKKKQQASSNVKTKTKIYVNLAQPESAEKVAKMNVDGIGLLRAEFIVAHIGMHPRLAIERGQQKKYIDMLAEKITMFAEPFGKRPIVYRATDFRTNEYRHLEGGEKFEPHEENPMIGYRGASRYIKDADVFGMEVEAIKKVRAAGHTNVHVMIPFVRIPEEIREIREIMREHDLKQSKDFKLWMMVEVPSSAIMVEEFIKEGIDGISIGTNDLTMLILGVDRDNQEIAYIYDERRSPVMWALKRVVESGKKHGITVSICGQAPSDYPDLARKLVEWGITSLSVTPDVVDRTRMLVAGIEKEMGMK